MEGLKTDRSLGYKKCQRYKRIVTKYRRQKRTQNEVDITHKRSSEMGILRWKDERTLRSFYFLREKKGQLGCGGKSELFVTVRATRLFDKFALTRIFCF